MNDDNITEPRSPGPDKAPPVPDEGFSSIYTCVRVLTASPLVTISTIHSTCPAGIASFASDLVSDRPALHLLHASWALDARSAAQTVSVVEEIKQAQPRSEFLLLASDSDEAMAYAVQGGQAVVGSGLAMVDERTWFPREPVDTLPRFNAIYDARLETWKRHELAKAVESVLLTYTPSYDTPLPLAFDRVREQLPNAFFANHELNSGTYRRFEHDELPRLYAQANVGLCLSAVEGCMRASMQYLLCGLPVVSTRSVGGRDRYFGTGYCRVVPKDDPDEVAFAVRQLMALNLDRARIREHVGHILAFDRYNVLLDVNRLARRHFGIDFDAVPQFTPFLGAVAKFTDGNKAREIVKNALRADN